MAKSLKLFRTRATKVRRKITAWPTTRCDHTPKIPEQKWKCRRWIFCHSSPVITTNTGRQAQTGYWPDGHWVETNWQGSR